jgi:hypothetical protein
VNGKDEGIGGRKLLTMEEILELCAKAVKDPNYWVIKIVQCIQQIEAARADEAKKYQRLFEVFCRAKVLLEFINHDQEPALKKWGWSAQIGSVCVEMAEALAPLSVSVQKGEEDRA